LPWWLGGSNFSGGNLAKQPILTPMSAWVLCLVWVACNVVIVMSETGGELRGKDPCLDN